MILRCSKCGCEMSMIDDTPLCNMCDRIIIEEYYDFKSRGWIKEVKR